MPLPTTGPLSVWEIANEFGVANQMSSFYSLADGIPASGLITIGHFRGKQFPTGQAVFTGAGTFTFTVPFGVKSISMVAVQAGSNYNSNNTTVTVGGVVVCRAQNGSRIGDGGGDGGNGGGSYYDGYYYYGGGGGGAGGYAGKGGDGQTYWTSGPGNGQGGGGGGGGHGRAGQDDPGGGGGVGLLGQGANGAGNGGYGTGGYGGSGGGNGVGRDGGLYGGGHGVGYSSSGRPGGALSYKNNVAVTPGQAVTIVIGPGQRGGATNNGAVRIIWGKDRAYPSTNTHDM